MIKEAKVGKAFAITGNGTRDPLCGASVISVKCKLKHF